jgi:hypothetical protein
MPGIQVATVHNIPFHIEGGEWVNISPTAVAAALEAGKAALAEAGLNPLGLEGWKVRLLDTEGDQKLGRDTVDGLTYPSKRAIELHLWSPEILAHELTHAQDPRLVGGGAFYLGSFREPSEEEVLATHSAIIKNTRLPWKRPSLKEVRGRMIHEASRRYRKHPVEIIAFRAQEIYRDIDGPDQLAHLL